MARRYEVAILVETVNAYSQTLMRGITQYIWENGPWNVCYEERAPDSPSPTWLENWHGDGIIVRDSSGETAVKALGSGAKFVDISEYSHLGVPSVHTNYAETSRLAAAHLRERFYPHFAFVGIKGRRFSELRRDSFMENLQAKCEVYEFLPDDLSQCWTEAEKPFPQWLAKLPKPCGLMSCDDLVGVNILQSCRMVGLRVPEDIAVIGVDNDEIQCTLASPPLTSVAQDSFRVGYEAAAMLHRLMKDEELPDEHLLIPPVHVVQRESTDAWAIDDELVLRALRIIHREACKGLTVDTLAATLNVTRRTLERHFHQVLKRTLKEEILRVQINRAEKLLLGTNLTLGAIAKRVGFCNASYLNTAFQRVSQITAGQYRKQHRGLSGQE